MPRFSIRFLLAAIAAVAVGCTVMFVLPGWVAIIFLGLVALTAPAAIVSGIVFARGYARAFAIGCASTGGVLPIIYMYMSMSIFMIDDFADQVDDEAATTIKVGFAIFAAMILLSGLVSMGVRRLAVGGTQQVASSIAVDQPTVYEIIPGRELPPNVDYAVLHTRMSADAPAE